MPHLRLSEADRERLGCPELLPIVVGGITNREAIEIAKLGYKTPTIWRAALFDKADLDVLAWTVAVWVALRHVGVETDIRTLEFDFDRLGFVDDEEPEQQPGDEGESGKAPGRSTSSARTSSTGGATSKPRSRSRSSHS